jgi:prepilin-type processing-associated H-X9-DG protein
MMRRDGRMRFSAAPSAFTVLELLVSIAIIGTMAGLILPAIQAARESARRIDCAHNLQQIGVSLHMRHDACGRFPAGWKSISGTCSARGWAAQLLPFLEHDALRRQLDERGPLAVAANAALRRKTLSALLCGSDIEEKQFALFRELGSHESGGQHSTETLVELPAANYVGVFGRSDPDDESAPDGEGPLRGNRELSIAEFRRGCSHTLFVGERTARKLPSTWLGFDVRGEDAAGRVTGQAWLGPNRSDADECEFDSRHPGGVNFLWGDGHVAWVVDEIDATLYRQLACVDD